MSFTLSAFLGLFKPQKGARGWADAVNQNFDTIDAAIKTLSAIQPYLESRRGIATFSDESSKAVTFDSEMTGEYAVLLTPDANVTYWVKPKTSSGFTINIGTTFTGSVDWFAVKI